MRLLREPLVHFAVLGALLFGLWHFARRNQPRPEPRPSEAALRAVTMETADLDVLRVGFRAAWKREPSPGEIGDLVQTFISEELLFRRALALGLDRDDRVVRRRLIEKMTTLARPVPPSSDPPAAVLRTWYETYRHRFVRPATVTFDHVFFDAKRRPEAMADATRALGGLVQAADAPAAAGVGDALFLPAKVVGKSEMELAHLVGEGFAKAAMTAPSGTWQGPITSKFGLHLIRVIDRAPQRLPAFEEIEKQVRADWLTVETRGLRAAAETLLPEYEIVLADDIRRQIAGEPGMAPFLRRLK